MKNTLTFVSVVYKIRKEYLIKCFESTLKAFHLGNEIEHIIIDNGNDVELSQWLKTYYSSTPFKLLKIEKNNGKTPAISLAIKNLNTPYFQVLDPDDWIESTKVKNIVEKLKKVDADWIALNYYYYSNSNLTFKNRQVLKTKKELIKFKKMPHLLWHFECNVIRSKKIFDDNFKMPENLNFYEDVFLNVYSLDKGKDFYFFNDSYYYYRIKQNGSNLSSTTKIIENNKEFRKMITAIIENISFKNNISKRHLVFFLGYQILAYSFFALLANKKWLTRKYLKDVNKEIKTKNPTLWKKAKPLNLKYLKLSNIITLWGFNIFLRPIARMFLFFRK